MSEQISGIAFPFRIDPNHGGVVLEAGSNDKLKQNIIQLLMTGIGERIMRRSYGGGVKQLLYDPNNDAMRAIIQRQIAKAIMRHEPRVVLQGVSVTQQDSTITAEVSYLVKQSQQRQELSLPISIGGL